ncbi:MULTISPECIES: CaiB/BaiF CoA-transferase family protein [unclassified Pseudofrankia]|uniref:CaiB/BaiF CoA transferase family protein n=1 Tax=unclassified Pseudofrankia TaxID=2994372 RepID=UPI0008DA80B9|nr:MULTISPECIES: CoA transferase [unclassified Pseudofrankia]MDT3441926.1 CoA transferase [Pseudofrankia sp. BMG5.37]OHV44568.1 formyl-CoA transferase [Pseudofrankia sp. BMG5.36]
MTDFLQGIRVLEAAVLLNGDALGMYLGDQGADVIKIEAPPRGDYVRDMHGQVVPRYSVTHLQCNKNKRSVALNLRTDEGREVFWKLLETADVFVDGFAGDACSRLGIGYEEQQQRRPEIIYCQVSGFGSIGPYAAIPTHGQMMNALAASTPVAMGEDGLTHAANAKMTHGVFGVGIGPDVAALHAAYSITSALLRRNRTGNGAHIDVSAADAVVVSGWRALCQYLNDERISDRRGVIPEREESDAAKYQYYETADRKFVLFCCIEHKFWDRFCELVDRADLTSRKDTAGPVDFAYGDVELRGTLQRIFWTRDLRDWIRVASEHELPIGPNYSSTSDLLADEHLAARGVFTDDVHPVAGPFTYTGRAGVVVGEPAYRVRRPAPAFGEHTDELLRELGYGPADVARLRAVGAI